MQWTITLLLELTFLGFCVIFIGEGVSELRKKKNYIKNVILICTGIFLALMSFWATYILLQ